ncbi:MATE family efflux transporter [Aliikangiella sp. IMCC44359]|uniref:MATE family efflux transporter n=1 Tax=Aliikangiella sp. IMCC44359 TaxID=3459125 RepID=UPI00403A9404
MLTSIHQEIKSLIPIAVPAILAQLAQMAMGVIDTVMAGHYSNQALAAIAIGTGLLHPVMIFFMGLFLAFNPIIAHLKGARAEIKIGANFRLGLILAILFSPVAITILLYADIILELLNVNLAVAQLATGYLQAATWGMPSLLLFLALRFCNEGLFSTTAVMAVTVISIPFNIIFNYWFMYGGYGLEAMGAIGVGYATALVWTIMSIGLFVYTFFTPKYKALEIFKHKTLPSWIEMKEVFKLGFPMAITLGFEITMFAAVSLMIARYPTQTMGAHQIAVNIASLAFMIPLGISQAITARVGFFSGQNNPASTRLAGYTGIGVSAALSAFSASTMVLIPTLIVSFYTQDVEVIQIAVSLLFFAAVFQFSDSIQVSSAGALRGVKDSKIPMIITAISYWLVGFPIGYFLAEKQGLQANGYWIGLIAGLSTAAILLLYRWTKLSKTI